MTANEKRSKTAKENAAKRREREDQDRREKALIHDNMIAILSDDNASTSDKLRAAEILKGYNL